LARYAEVYGQKSVQRYRIGQVRVEYRGAQPMAGGRVVPLTASEFIRAQAMAQLREVYSRFGDRNIAELKPVFEAIASVLEREAERRQIAANGSEQ
jgi:hypothetical protein